MIDILFGLRILLQSAFKDRRNLALENLALRQQLIGLNERQLKRILKSYFRTYHNYRTHLSLGKDAPDSRRMDQGGGPIVEFPEVVGLQHHYERRAA